MRRRPRGYIGTNHETTGASLLSVLHVLPSPEKLLGAERVKKLTNAVQPLGWYPVKLLLALMEDLDKHAGHYGLLRMGRRRFELSHKTRVPQNSARDVVYGIDEMYHFSNRGRNIGGWQVLRFEPGHAELEKTTPHHCLMEQGLLSAAFSAAHCPAVIAQTQCFREGADSCIYTISSTLTDERWSGAGPPPPD
jgi:hypothetical protein